MDLGSKGNDKCVCMDLNFFVVILMLVVEGVILVGGLEFVGGEFGVVEGVIGGGIGGFVGGGMG